jgi:AcrR family transcriptional regulator
MNKSSSARARNFVLPPPMVPRPGRSRRNLAAEVWRDRIIQTVLILGYDHGDGAVTIQLVASTAGLSRAHFYTFFPSRSELHGAIVTARGRVLAGDLVAKVERSRGVNAKVLKLVHEVFRITAAHRRSAAEDHHGGRSLGEFLSSMRAAAARPIAHELAGRRASPLIGHAAIAMSECAALAWASERRLSRQASIDIVVRLIRDVLRSRRPSSAAVNATRTTTRRSR